MPVKLYNNSPVSDDVLSTVLTWAKRTAHCRGSVIAKVMGRMTYRQPCCANRCCRVADWHLKGTPPKHVKDYQRGALFSSRGRSGRRPPHRLRVEEVRTRIETHEAIERTAGAKQQEMILLLALALEEAYKK